jgi:hypothetical protein
MLRKSSRSNSILVIFFFSLGIMAYGQNTLNVPDFSAVQVFQSRKATMEMKVYVSGSSVRLERSGALSTLYVPSASKVYNLTTYPDNSHQCVAMKPEQAKMLPSPLELLQGSVVKRRSLGTETVDGHLSTVELIVVKRSDGSTIESKVWEAQDLSGIPVKIESHIDEITLSATYRDIIVGAANRDLFTVPQKCTPFEKMGQVVEAKTIQ